MFLKKVTANDMYALTQKVNIMESIESMNEARRDVKKIFRDIKKAAKGGLYRYYVTKVASDSTYRVMVADLLHERGFRAHWDPITLSRYQLSVNWDLSKDD